MSPARKQKNLCVFFRKRAIELQTAVSYSHGGGQSSPPRLFQSCDPPSIITASRWTRCKGKPNKEGGKTYPILQDAGNSGTSCGDVTELRPGGRYCGEDLDSSKTAIVRPHRRRYS